MCSCDSAQTQTKLVKHLQDAVAEVGGRGGVERAEVGVGGAEWRGQRWVGGAEWRGQSGEGNGIETCTHSLNISYVREWPLVLISLCEQVEEIERERIAARESGGVAGGGRYSPGNLSAMEAPEFSTKSANEFQSGAFTRRGWEGCSCRVPAIASLQAK